MKLKFEANGHGTSPNALEATFEEKLVAAPALKEKGFKFKSWNTKPDGSGVNYAPGAVIKEENSDLEINALYAVWEKKSKALPIILLLIVLLGAVIFGAWYMLSHQKTAVIAPAQVEDTHDTSDGQIRIKISSAVTIKDDTMQDLNFQNINTDRLMQCKIKLEGSDKYIYESQYVDYGDMIQADVIKTSSLKSGENTAIAEIYTFNPETKEKIGQVNVKILLIK